MTYDKNNVFAKILRGEIPAKKILETETALAFYDVHPKASTHALVIPKGAYLNAQDFFGRASDREILGFSRAVAQTMESLTLEGGCRLIANQGLNGGQEVPHFHVHILGGQSLGPMLQLSQ